LALYYFWNRKEAMAALKPAPKSYLIGGDGFHKVFWPSLMLFFCLTHRSVATWGPMAIVYAFWRRTYDVLLDSLMRGAHRMMWWSVFGLLSSSCCALQLVLNIFNFGCAGFNTYLGPVRPVFLAITVVLQLRMWELATPNLGLPSTPDHYLPSIIASTVLASFLSVLPELTEWRNSRKASKQNESGASLGVVTDVVLSLEGLGCVACSSAVQGAVQSVANGKLVASKVALEGKQAQLTLACNEEEAKKTLVPELISKIQDAGFDAALVHVQKGRVARPDSTSDSHGGPFSAVLAGLLSSSCCLLQLAVNLLATLDVVHIGCAGFNKVLGPWRPHLRASTFVWLGYLWFRSRSSAACCKPQRRMLLFNTFLCLSMMFLPELLRWSGSTAIAPPTDGAKLLKLKVDGMGCEACEMHVRSVMDRSSGVISSRADFKRGYAEVEIAENWGFDMDSVFQRLKADGYEAGLAD
jgi:copper chaperone CopZ